jgi:hypothetical protein
MRIEAALETILVWCRYLLGSPSEWLRIGAGCGILSFIGSLLLVALHLERRIRFNDPDELGAYQQMLHLSRGRWEIFRFVVLKGPLLEEFSARSWLIFTYTLWWDAHVSDVIVVSQVSTALVTTFLFISAHGSLRRMPWGRRLSLLMSSAAFLSAGAAAGWPASVVAHAAHNFLCSTSIYLRFPRRLESPCPSPKSVQA